MNTNWIARLICGGVLVFAPACADVADGDASGADDAADESDVASSSEAVKFNGGACEVVAYAEYSYSDQKGNLITGSGGAGCHGAPASSQYQMVMTLEGRSQLTIDGKFDKFKELARTEGAFNGGPEGKLGSLQVVVDGPNKEYRTKIVVKETAPRQRTLRTLYSTKTFGPAD